MKIEGQNPDQVRKAAYAGTFYPDDPVELSELVDSYLKEANSNKEIPEIKGIVSPHAGYIYSGSCAAASYSLLKNKKFETVIVISPSHQLFFAGTAVFNGGVYQTPLGNIYIDLELASEIANLHPDVSFSDNGHIGGSQSEHSLEVQLPFLQKALGNFKLVPLVMGSQEFQSATALGEVLASVTADKNCLIVASSDLSHYHNLETAKKKDNKIIEAINRYDWKLLHSDISSQQSEACGCGPMIACMYACHRLGARKSKVIKYTHSGVVSGDNDQVVGYLSAIFSK